jgi:hypothetical protein
MRRVLSLIHFRPVLDVPVVLCFKHVLESALGGDGPSQVVIRGEGMEGDGVEGRSTVTLELCLCLCLCLCMSDI